MQTRFQIRKIDLSKGYCLVVTDKNHAQITFGFDHLDTQLQRLEQLPRLRRRLRTQNLTTVNLLVQRNIPVTFAKPAAEVINDATGIRAESEPNEPARRQQPPHEPAIRKADAQCTRQRKRCPTARRAKIPLQPFASGAAGNPG